MIGFRPCGFGEPAGSFYKDAIAGLKSETPVRLAFGSLRAGFRRAQGRLLGTRLRRALSEAMFRIVERGPDTTRPDPAAKIPEASRRQLEALLGEVVSVTARSSHKKA